MLSMSWNLAGCPPHDVRKTFINVLISDNPKRNESQCLEELLKSSSRMRSPKGEKERKVRHFKTNKICFHCEN